MVVEDNREIRHYLSQSLSENYQIYEASNGKEALAILSENEVNLILTDVMMPEMDGIQLCNAVKSHLQTSLYTKMKALTGESVKEFIRRIRLNTAAEMILRNEHSIAEISFLVGFPLLPISPQVSRNISDVSLLNTSRNRLKGKQRKKSGKKTEL